MQHVDRHVETLYHFPWGCFRKQLESADEDAIANIWPWLRRGHSLSGRCRCGVWGSGDLPRISPFTISQFTISLFTISRFTISRFTISLRPHPTYLSRAKWAINQPWHTWLRALGRQLSLIIGRSAQGIIIDCR